MSIVKKMKQDDIVRELQQRAEEARQAWLSAVGNPKLDVSQAHGIAAAYAEAVEIAEGMGVRT